RRDARIIVFLTVCTKDRKAILASSESHALLIDAWRRAKMWQVGRYVIMPDHIHLFCAPAKSETQPLLHWVKYWKSSAARNWIESADSPVWQRHFWDTQLRRSESYDQKWQYVVENPVRAGLVARSEDWSFQGGVERTALVTTLEGRAPSRPKHKRKGTLEDGRRSFKVWDDTEVV